MKLMTILCFILLSFGAFATEKFYLSVKSSFLQSFQHKATNLKNQKMSEAISFSKAIDKVKTVCFGDNFMIIDEKVSMESGGGAATIKTILTIECEPPIPVIDL